jgi:hypothetical protein
MLGLHPGLKFEHFKQWEYSTDWIKETEDLLHSKFLDYCDKLKATLDKAQLIASGVSLKVCYVPFFTYILTAS